MNVPISPARWELIKDVFEAALGRQPESLPKFLDEACGGDAEVRAEVERLLYEDRRAGSFMDKPPVEPTETLSAPRRAFSDGEQAGPRYRITRFLGAGGMGEVYEAEDLELGEAVALKTLRPAGALDERMVARFKNEIQLARKVTHPNVCRIFDLGSHAGIAFLTMELVRGETLSRRLRRSGPLPAEEALTILDQISGALACAHEAGVIHRDFKSGNIMLTAAGNGTTRAVVTDFGLAQGIAPGEGSTPLSIPGQIMGTPPYMAPEQLAGGKVTRASDIYALGVVMCEMVTGSRPRDLKGGDLRSHAPRLDARWERAITRCLAADPADRFDSARDVAAAVRAPLGGPFRRWIAVPALLIGALGAVSVLPPVRERARDWIARSSVPAQKNLVVLPFLNVGNDPANQAFCDGLLETATSTLTQLGPVHAPVQIVPASEVRKQGVGSAVEARKLFGANLVITGSIQRRGGDVRITENLVDARTLRQLRARTLAYHVGQLESVQEAVVSSMADLLNLELAPDSRKILTAAGTAIPAANEDYLKAVGYLQRYDMVGNLSKAIEALNRSIERDANFAPAHVALSTACLRRYREGGDRQFLELARVHADQALGLDKSSPFAHVAAGMALANAGNHEQAIAAFQEALTLDPKNVDATRELAKSDEALGRFAEAEAAYKKAVAFRQNDWLSSNDLGIFYFNRQRYTDAAKSFEQVVRITPDNLVAHRNLGGVYSGLGRYQDAEREFRRSIALGPTPSAYSSLGAILIYRQMYREAVPMMERAIALSPKNYRKAYILWSNLGDAYRYTPEFRHKAADAYRRAIEDIEKQLVHDPNNVDLLSRLALYWAKSDNKERALQEITRTVHLPAINSGVLFRAAVVYDLIGQKDRAMAALEEAVHEGFSVEEIRHEPELSNLRDDKRYKRLIDAAKGSKLPESP